MIATRAVTGLVLAGGRATRMGDVDKGLQPFRGEPLVVHVLARLAPQVGAILINANRHLEIYQQLGHRVIGDIVEGYAGPLAGLHAGLAACETDYLVAAACDVPLLPRDLVARLGEGLVANHGDDEKIDVAFASTAARHHPVFCLMRRTVAPSLAAFIAEGGRSVNAWVERMRGVAVSFDREDAFRNLNTLEELRDAEGSV